MKSKTPQIKVVLTLVMLAAFTVVGRAVVTVDFGQMTAPSGNVITSYDPASEDGLSWLHTADTSRLVAQSIVTPGGSNYLLSAITMKFNVGIVGDFPAPSAFTIDFYQLSSPGQSPATGSFLSTQSGTMQPTAAQAVSNSFFTFQLDAPVTLEAGTSYGYVLAFTAAEEYNFLRLAVSDGSPDINGTRAWINTNGGGWGNSGETYVYYMQGTAVPEPSTIALFGAAALFVLWKSRKSRKASGLVPNR